MTLTKRMWRASFHSHVDCATHPKRAEHTWQLRARGQSRQAGCDTRGRHATAHCRPGCGTGQIYLRPPRPRPAIMAHMHSHSGTRAGARAPRQGWSRRPVRIAASREQPRCMHAWSRRCAAPHWVHPARIRSGRHALEHASSHRPAHGLGVRRPVTPPCCRGQRRRVGILAPAALGWRGAERTMLPCMCMCMRDCVAVSTGTMLSVHVQRKCKYFSHIHIGL